MTHESFFGQDASRVAYTLATLIAAARDPSIEPRLVASVEDLYTGLGVPMPPLHDNHDTRIAELVFAALRGVVLADQNARIQMALVRDKEAF